MEFYLPLLSNLGSFQLYGLVTQMLRPILTRRGRIVDFLLCNEVWVSCLCSSLAAPWTSLWYPTSYRQAAGVRAGRRQGMASANCTAISSELGVWGWEYYARSVASWKWGMVGDGGLADMPAAGKDSNNFICLVQKRQSSTCLSTLHEIKSYCPAHGWSN